MARIRSVKPEFWDDRKLARRTSRDARLLYIALWNLADEFSRVNGDPQWIKGQVFSYDEDIDSVVIEKLLAELSVPELGAVVPYEADGDPYLLLPKLAKHQRLEPGKVPSRLPEPPESVLRAYLSARGTDESARDADTNALLYGAGGREQVAGGRDAREAPPTTASCALLDEHLAAYRSRPPRTVIEQTGRQIDRLMSDSEITEDQIRRGLRRLRERPDVGAGMLPTFVNEVRQFDANPELARSRASPNGRRQQEHEAHTQRALERAARREASA